MRVIVYTLTRDRLAFTKYSFETLWKNAGMTFDHLVIDNGSQDGTRDWLTQEYGKRQGVTVMLNAENRGISIGSNMALDQIERVGGYDIVVKMDNDCEVVSPDILPGMLRAFADRKPFGQWMALSPRVEGIVNQPARARTEGRGGLTIGVTGIIGGLFHVVPWEVYRQYRYPPGLPKASGQDDHFCIWLNEHGVMTGYVENLVVRHYLTTHGQAVALPDYFKRKWVEEKEPPTR